jgi:hypothetical protein
MLKGNAVPLYDNQARRRSTGIALPIFDPVVRRELVISATPRQIYPRERDPVPIAHRTLSVVM